MASGAFWTAAGSCITTRPKLPGAQSLSRLGQANILARGSCNSESHLTAIERQEPTLTRHGRVRTPTAWSRPRALPRVWQGFHLSAHADSGMHAWEKIPPRLPFSGVLYLMHRLSVGRAWASRPACIDVELRGALKIGKAPRVSENDILR